LFWENVRALGRRRLFFGAKLEPERRQGKRQPFRGIRKEESVNGSN